MAYPRLSPPRRLPAVRRYLPLAKPTPPTPSRVAVTREYPPDKIALRIGPQGAGARWAEDEPNPDFVISDIEFGTEMSGGYKDFQCTLGRNPQLDWRDLVAYYDAYAYQPGVAKVWEGFLDKAPDVSGEHKSISPNLLGYQSILEDDNAAQVGFIDCDIAKFQDPSAQRRLDLAAANNWLMAQIVIGFQDAGVDPAGVIIDFANVEAVAAKIERGETWYYGDGVDIGYVKYDLRTNFGKDATMLTRVTLCNNDVGAGAVFGTNHEQVEALNQQVSAGGAGKKYVLIESAYSGGFVGSMTNNHRYGNIRVVGNHGITLQGVWPNVGLSAKQMLGYLIPNFASPLTTDNEALDDDGYIIPQAWYGDPTSVADIVKDLVKYGLYDWFVYGDKRFQLRKPGTYGKFWKAYVGPSNLNEVGLDSQRLWSSVVVSYTDVDGSTKTVGPPGSQASVTSAELQITDPQHPAVQAGRNRRAVLDLQGIGTPATAIAVGKRFLEEANLLNRSGSATLSGYVMDQYGIFWPAACVKAGDWIAFVDASDRGYRKIINTSYRHSERSNEIDLDAPASGLEALLERLQVGLISLGVN